MSRVKQRENRRVKDREIRNGTWKPAQEEQIDLIDYCGIKDPTPYLTVKNIIRRERAAIRSQVATVRTATT